MAAVLYGNNEKKIFPNINGEAVTPSVDNGKNTVIVDKNLIQVAERSEQNKSLTRQRKMLYRRLEFRLRYISIGKATVGSVAKFGGSGIIIKGIVHSIT